MRFAVVTTPEVESQIREIDTWWRKNRPAAAGLFLDEIGEWLEVIASAPQIGRLYRQSPVLHVRRVLLRETRYHLYYVAMPAEVRVLAIWHARRGVGPPLRSR